MCEVIGASQDRRFIAESDEIQGDRLPPVLVGDGKVRADIRLASTGVGSKQVGRRRSRTNQEMPTLHGYPKDPIPPSGITSTCSTEPLRHGSGF